MQILCNFINVTNQKLLNVEQIKDNGINLKLIDLNLTVNILKTYSASSRLNSVAIK